MGRASDDTPDGGGDSEDSPEEGDSVEPLSILLNTYSGGSIDSSLSWEAAVVPLSCMSAKGLAKVPSLGTPSLLKQGLFKVPYS